MPYLTVAVAVVGALCLLNLLLTTAVVRRLREHTALLSSRPADSGPGFEVIGTGERPGAFAGVDTHGRPLTGDDLPGRTLVAFLSPDCPACTQGLPALLQLAGRFPGGRERVLVVVAGAVTGDDAQPHPKAAELTARIDPVARVLLEAYDGPASQAFRVVAHPSWVMLDDGVVTDAAVGLNRLPDPAAGPGPAAALDRTPDPTPGPAAAPIPGPVRSPVVGVGPGSGSPA